MNKGLIYKALSGFYYVEAADETIRCRARGRFRFDNIQPLVGDMVEFERGQNDEGVIKSILPRRNSFIRPPIANMDMMVIIASRAVPVTVPFLIDRIAAIAELNDCEPVIVINKCDLDPGDELFEIYSGAGYKTIRVSAETGQGIDELSRTVAGSSCVFTGNSGVGKSSILNALDSGFHIQVGDVSDKLGRGRHTTRHTELYRLANGAVIADTPGFSAFDPELMESVTADKLQYAFREFTPYRDKCQFLDCAHVKEKGCAVLEALREGKIHPSRHSSYVKLYEQLRQVKKWEIKSPEQR
ncbi:MAG: ribosome small subunit-dependent GTPase A [Oscillospiraceae bacterium]|nr:ribosome small subunit-dependent GTPase A [Oscillospiraceae bacterium]